MKTIKTVRTNYLFSHINHNKSVTEHGYVIRLVDKVVKFGGASNTANAKSHAPYSLITSHGTSTSKPWFYAAHLKLVVVGGELNPHLLEHRILSRGLNALGEGLGCRTGEGGARLQGTTRKI